MFCSSDEGARSHEQPRRSAAGNGDLVGKHWGTVATSILALGESSNG
jgi:hypothetical protein